MDIKHPNCRLAVCCLLATALLPACGGGSSSSAGGSGTGSRTYQQGYAAGTAATLNIVLEDLRALHATLTGSEPAQTSRGTLGRSFASLEPRQRATLAASLLEFINRVQTAQAAAAAPTAGEDEARAAQEAADDALRALQLVITADTADRAGGDEQVQTAAIEALQAITRVDVTDPDARVQVNRALSNALEAAEDRVADLEEELAAALTAAAQSGQAAETAAGTITSLRTSLTAAQSSLNALTRSFGTLPSFGRPSTGRATTLPRVTTTYHPRRTGVQMVFDTSTSTTTNDARTTVLTNVYPIFTRTDSRQDERVFDPVGGFEAAREYDVTNRGTAVTGGFDLTPDAVLYNPTGSNPRVFTATNPNTSHFPGRGTVYRGGLRYVRDNTGLQNDDRHDQWVYRNIHRLIEQGVDAEPSTPSSPTTPNSQMWQNWDATASMTFQYKPSGGFTMGFGGPGVIFSDLERYAAKGGRGPTASGLALASGTIACGAAGTGNTDNWCDDPVTANVEISFGTPQADPYNQPNTLYWYVAAQSPRIEAAATPDLAQAGDRIADHDIGTYELILSNHAGASRQLAYAAYGLFNYFENLGWTSTGYIGRMQTFHYGVDAFQDSAGRRPADLTGNDAIEGTFRGKTAAWIVASTANLQWNGHLHFIQNLFRTRGDIELRVCLGDANCAFGAGGDDDLTDNQIAGTISNLEYAHLSRRDLWAQDATGGVRGPDLRNKTVKLQAADIGTDGTYNGVANVGGISGASDGTYEGAFYGPAGTGLETAGTWRINMRTWEWVEMDAIIGSFGAVCAEGDCAPGATP